jgi:hypothetical protein
LTTGITRSAADSPSRSSSTPTSTSRTLSCTCGAASPMPWYSSIVSTMSSMSFWKAGVLMSEGSTFRARARSTGCPMRAILRIDIAVRKGLKEPATCNL